MEKDERCTTGSDCGKFVDEQIRMLTESRKSSASIAKQLFGVELRGECELGIFA